MSLTVTIPTRGYGPRLRSSVEGALRCAAAVGPDTEVLVVVNGADRVPALAGLDAPQLRVVYLPEANVARARNVGIERARHDTVLFGDDGALYPPTWCADLAGGLRDPAYPVVTAPVRVPVTGPVTAFLDYQRVFDAPPVSAAEAQTVTGNCGLRRDRLPRWVRFDEVNTASVAEDVAFGHALRTAGIRVRWLAEAPPGLHALSDGIEEITGRLLRYGQGAARMWYANGAPGLHPRDVLALYRGVVDAAATGRRYRFRRFREILAPRVRSAFTLYDYLFDVSFLLGYLDELGTRLGRPLVELDHDELATAWRGLGGRAAAGVPRLSAGEWAELPVDLLRLDAGTATEDPLVAEVDRALAAYARPLPGDVPDRPPAAAAASGGPAARAGAEPGPREPGPREPGRGEGGAPGARERGERGPGEAGADPARLARLWQRLRDRGRPVTPHELNAEVREVGFAFRTACAAIERGLSAARPGR